MCHFIPLIMQNVVHFSPKPKPDALSLIHSQEEICDIVEAQLSFFDCLFTSERRKKAEYFMQQFKQLQDLQDHYWQPEIGSPESQMILEQLRKVKVSYADMRTEMPDLPEYKDLV